MSHSFPQIPKITVLVYSLNSLQGVIQGINSGAIIGVIRGILGV